MFGCKFDGYVDVMFGYVMMMLWIDDLDVVVMSGRIYYLVVIYMG